VPEWFSYFGIVLPANAKPILLIVSGIGWLLRVAYRYRGDFQAASVTALLEDTEVSQMRPRAVRLKGEIVGRGVPGVFWSPDLVLRDATGISLCFTGNRFPSLVFSSPSGPLIPSSVKRSTSKDGSDVG
jgi:hypothetical protein